MPAQVLQQSVTWSAGRKVGGCLRPDGLCLIVVGGGMALREFMFESCNSPRARPCDNPIFGN
jgi:hypothetical protein